MRSRHSQKNADMSDDAKLRLPVTFRDNDRIMDSSSLPVQAARAASLFDVCRQNCWTFFAVFGKIIMLLIVLLFVLYVLMEPHEYADDPREPMDGVHLDDMDAVRTGNFDPVRVKGRLPELRASALQSNWTYGRQRDGRDLNRTRGASFWDWFGLGDKDDDDSDDSDDDYGDNLDPEERHKLQEHIDLEDLEAWDDWDSSDPLISDEDRVWIRALRSKYNVTSSAEREKARVMHLAEEPADFARIQHEQQFHSVAGDRVERPVRHFWPKYTLEFPLVAQHAPIPSRERQQSFRAMWRRYVHRIEIPVNRSRGGWRIPSATAHMMWLGSKSVYDAHHSAPTRGELHTLGHRESGHNEKRNRNSRRHRISRGADAQANAETGVSAFPIPDEFRHGVWFVFNPLAGAEFYRRDGELRRDLAALAPDRLYHSRGDEKSKWREYGYAIHFDGTDMYDAHIMQTRLRQMARHYGQAVLFRFEFDSKAKATGKRRARLICTVVPSFEVLADISSTFLAMSIPPPIAQTREHSVNE